LAEQRLPALLVLDTDGLPHAVVPGSQLVRELVPPYALEVPLLAAVVDERGHAEAAERLDGLTVAEWIPKSLYRPPVVGPDAHPMEVAALMARAHSPLVAVIERDGDRVTMLGSVSAARLMQHFVGQRP
ncbi:CBS domain-containing protein, partial [Streptomyces wuyuanensis]|uniref:CBS domain-containing protein n=1 Tax=Streptomyces wuyuanensis TaxID=1196353 RepID=UPI003D74F0F6